jgi:hypothetical protein
LSGWVIDCMFINFNLVQNQNILYITNYYYDVWHSVHVCTCVCLCVHACASMHFSDIFYPSLSLHAQEYLIQHLLKVLRLK